MDAQHVSQSLIFLELTLHFLKGQQLSHGSESCQVQYITVFWLSSLPFGFLGFVSSLRFCLALLLSLSSCCVHGFPAEILGFLASALHHSKVPQNQQRSTASTASTASGDSYSRSIRNTAVELLEEHNAAKQPQRIQQMCVWSSWNPCVNHGRDLCKRTGPRSKIPNSSLYILQYAKWDVHPTSQRVTLQCKNISSPKKNAFSTRLDFPLSLVSIRKTIRCFSSTLCGSLWLSPITKTWADLSWFIDSYCRYCTDDCIFFQGCFTRWRLQLGDLYINHGYGYQPVTFWDDPPRTGVRVYMGDIYSPILQWVATYIFDIFSYVFFFPDLVPGWVG